MKNICDGVGCVILTDLAESHSGRRKLLKYLQCLSIFHGATLRCIASVYTFCLSTTVQCTCEFYRIQTYHFTACCFRNVMGALPRSPYRRRYQWRSLCDSHVFPFQCIGWLAEHTSPSTVRLEASLNSVLLTLGSFDEVSIIIGFWIMIVLN